MNKRQEKIIKLLSEQGEITIPTLSKLLDVTEMTIHRDLNKLESKNLLKKKRGGAIFIEKDNAINHNNLLNEVKKIAIAEEAVKLIKDGDTVLFDNSTTAFEVAKKLNNHRNLTVYTTSLNMANEIVKNKNIILYCSGGLYFRESTGFVGSAAIDFVSKLHVSKCIIGATGISGEYGITDPYISHIFLEKEIINAAEMVILVADHTKFGKVAIEKVAEIEDIDYIITDSKLDKNTQQDISNKTNLIIAKVE